MSTGTRLAPLALLALLIPLPAGAAGLTASVYGEQQMLSGPGPFNDVVGTLADKEPVTVLQCTSQQRWCLVKPLHGHAVGWVEGPDLIGADAKNAVTPSQFGNDLGVGGFFHQPGTTF